MCVFLEGVGIGRRGGDSIARTECLCDSLLNNCLDDVCTANDASVDLLALFAIESL